MFMVTFIWVLYLDATNRWPERTRKDLKAVDAAIEKYKADRHASTSSSAIFQECLQRASQVQTVADYQAIIAYYVSSFNDDSLKLTFCSCPEKSLLAWLYCDLSTWCIYRCIRKRSLSASIVAPVRGRTYCM